MERIKITSLQLGDKRAKQKSAFARTSAFANYKLFAFANYGCSLLLAPRQKKYLMLPHQREGQFSTAGGKQPGRDASWAARSR